MEDAPFEELEPRCQLRLRRRALGWTQGELARRVGTSQPTLAAIESGQRGLSAAMEVKLRKVLSCTPSEMLRRHRSELVAAAEELGLTNLRVFGSVARGEDTAQSDIDLMVELGPQQEELFPTVTFAQRAERILGAPVDVILRPSYNVAKRPSAQRVLAESVAV